MPPAVSLPIAIPPPYPKVLPAITTFFSPLVSKQSKKEARVLPELRR